MHPPSPQDGAPALSNPSEPVTGKLLSSDDFEALLRLRKEMSGQRGSGSTATVTVGLIRLLSAEDLTMPGIVCRPVFGLRSMQA